MCIRDRDRVAHARAAADADHHLEVLVALELHDLLDERHDRVLAAVEDALATDRDECHVREHLEVAIALGLRDDAAILQRLAHQARLDVGPTVAGDELGHRPTLTFRSVEWRARGDWPTGRTRRYR